MAPLDWLRTRDRDLAALRRAARGAIVMPSMFAVGTQVIGRADLATFAAFGSFAMLLLVDFGGPLLDRLLSYIALAAAGAVLVVLGTLASRNALLAAVSMAVVGLAVLFAGVVSSVLAGATTSLLLAFILPVSLQAPVSAIPDRLAGWALASVVAVPAAVLLWPAPVREPLRGAAVAAARALAARLRSDVARRLGGPDAPTDETHAQTVAAAAGSVAGLRRTFLATPYRPTGLSTANRTVVRLVDQLTWLDAMVAQAGLHAPGSPVDRSACAVRSAAAVVLDRAADLLERHDPDPDALRASLDELEARLAQMEDRATHHLPVRRLEVPADGPDGGETEAEVRELVTSLDPSFRAQELAFAVSLVGRTADLTAAAERRSWPERLLGRQPTGVPTTLAAAQERAAAHVEPHSVWLHNSLRGAAGLGIAVLVADLSGVQHSFWVVLGALSVLRSNALSTGQNAVRGLAGTAVGFAIGAALLVPIGTDRTVLWVLLPLAILVAGVAPAAISFAAGQAGFTVVLVVLFNIVAPSGWQVGLVRVEDVALGCAVSLLVGLLFWPRGASAALNRALAEAYADSADYLAHAVAYGMVRCDPTTDPLPAPAAEATRSAAAARRLDDAFRAFLAERGAKPVPLAEVSGLVTGVAGLRLAADAVLDIWEREDGRAPGDRSGARAELVASSAAVRDWYDDLAASIAARRPVRDPLPHDQVADGRLVDAVRADLRTAEGRSTATAVRLIWTGDHLDAARRLQGSLVGPARAIAGG